MKKFLWLIVSVVTMGSFCACDNEDNSEEIAPITRTYTIITTLRLSILEFNNKNELINSQVWSNVSDNNPKTFTAHQLATKFIIYIELDSKYEDMVAEIHQYVAQVFHLTTTNIDITIDGSTLITDVQPIR